MEYQITYIETGNNVSIAAFFVDILIFKKQAKSQGSRSNGWGLKSKYGKNR